VLATGAEQCRDTLHTLAVAGETLLPRFAGKLILSGEVLAAGGAAQVIRRLRSLAAPKIAIVGGSHSALAAANLLLNHPAKADFGPGAITLMHRRPLRVFYPSAAAAAAEGYTDFDADDVCPVSQRLFRLAGFRLEARELVMRALGIGGRAPEPRLRLHRLQGLTAEAEAHRVLGEADLVIAALGYRPSALPVFDMNGHRLPLAKDGPVPVPLVDRLCRVLDINRRPVPGLLGLGLAAGFVPSGTLGGEPSFRGQTNGIWLWQNDVGAMVVDALLHGRADHVVA
ncbi:MAG: aminotransferase DegT, partial [Pseudomonadota bacterium]|nr:aminotransferase DegT [Pseudomonadota bacterium]